MERFKEMKSFPNAIEPMLEEVLRKDYKLKNNWNHDYFKNNKDIILELGCGKGEYTIGLAERFPDKNYIGVDIKGARMWRGCKTAIERNLNHIAFARTRIDLIGSFFGFEEVSEIWITFPDPQKEKKTKRLTAAKFLNLYKTFLKNDGVIHLKTDSDIMYQYTIELINFNGIKILKQFNDIYNSSQIDEILTIKTFYEKQFLAQNKSIKYIKFTLAGCNHVEELP